MNNLSLLFSSATPDPEPIKLLGGAFTLFKRSTSHQWQHRLKFSTGAWHSASAGSDQLAEATTQAIAIYETVKVKLASDLAINKGSDFSPIGHARTSCSCQSSLSQSQ